MTSPLVPVPNVDVFDEGGDEVDGATSDDPSEMTMTSTATSSSAHPPLHPDPAPAPSAPETATETSASALIISASDKAGMEGVDREAIDRIILRESGDSAYMRQQRKRDEAVNEKIKTMKRKLDSRDASDPNWRTRVERELAPRIRELIEESSEPESGMGSGVDGSGDDRWSTAVVVDMDSFFISCELLDKPHLKDVPCCVGSIRSIISTSNYAARRYGVRSAMAGFIGDKLVKELSGGKQTLRFLRSNFGLYKDKSQQVREVLEQYDPHLRSYSLDEAYMDLGPYFELRIGRGWTHDRIQEHWTAVSSGGASAKSEDECEEGGKVEDGDTDSGCEEGELPTTGEGSVLVKDNVDEEQGHNDDGPAQRPGPTPSPEDVVAEMRASVFSKTGLTCSAGIAPNHMLAKISSDINKPNGQLLVRHTREDVMEFVRPLKIRKIPGIGRVAEKTLQAFDIFTVGDLYEQRALVRFLFQPTSASFFLRASLGLGSSSSSSGEDENATEDGEGEMSAETRQKGISRERTFRSGNSWAELNDILERISRKLADDMSSKDLRGRTLTLKVKLHTFDVLTRCRSLPVGTYYRTAGDIVPVAAELLAEARRNHHAAGGGVGRRFDVRLLGVRCSNLLTREEEAASAGQLSLSRFLSRPTTATEAAAATAKDHDHHRDGDGAIVDLTNDCGCEESSSSATGGMQRGTTDKIASLETRKVGGYRGRESPKDPRGDGDYDDHNDHRDDSVPHHSGGGDDLNENTDVDSCGPTVRCPVCDRTLRHLDNVELNRHVDACLSGRAIRELVRGEGVTDADSVAVADASRSTTIPASGVPSLAVATVLPARGGVQLRRKTEKRLLTDFFADGGAAKRLAS